MNGNKSRTELVDRWFEDIEKQGPLFRRLASRGLIRPLYDVQAMRHLSTCGWGVPAVEGSDRVQRLARIPSFIVSVFQVAGACEADPEDLAAIREVIRHCPPLAEMYEDDEVGYYDFWFIDAEQQVLIGFGLGLEHVYTGAQASVAGGTFKDLEDDLERRVRDELLFHPFELLNVMLGAMLELKGKHHRWKQLPSRQTLEEALAAGPDSGGRYLHPDGQGWIDEQQMYAALEAVGKAEAALFDANCVFRAYFADFDARLL